MKITLENTPRLVEIDTRHLTAAQGLTEGVVPARIWEGETESGIPVICFVTRVLVHKDATPEQMRQFEIELQETRQATPAAQGIPLRLIL